MAKLILSVCLILGFSGCSGLTIGPTIERKVIIVKSGTGIEVLDQVTVKARLLQNGRLHFKQDIGGWVAMHPDHWESVKKEIIRLRKKAGE